MERERLTRAAGGTLVAAFLIAGAAIGADALTHSGPQRPAFVNDANLTVTQTTSTIDAIELETAEPSEAPEASETAEPSEAPEASEKPRSTEQPDKATEPSGDQGNDQGDGNDNQGEHKSSDGTHQEDGGSGSDDGSGGD